MMNPYGLGWRRSFTALCWKWISLSTPAILALALAAFNASGSMSKPWISVSILRFILSCASSFASYQHFLGTRCFHSSARKERFMPGAISAAIIAASIGKVPLPQKGSTRILSLFHGVSMIRADASVSVIGAFTVILRYPLLCRDTPEVSIPIVATSFINATRIGKLAPSSSNQDTPYTPFRRSTMAFFIMDWISDGLKSLLFTELALATQNFPSLGI